MRVYEFAKQKGLTSKEIVTLLEKAGFSSYTHISVLREDALASLNKHFDNKGKKPVYSVKKTEKKVAPQKKEIPESEKKEKIISTGKKESTKEVFKPSPKISKPSIPKTSTQLTPKQKEEPLKSESEGIVLKEGLPLFKAAELLGKNIGEVILALMAKGMVCNRNHFLAVDVISSLASDYGINVISASKEKKVSDIIRRGEGGESRWPVVVVMGHVDHGKTTLLDFIRKTRVAAKEKGGITQHLGAYEVDTEHGKIVFLDTPGHAAFSHMRERGTRVTDIVILVVAADDGIMPQTVEVIKAAKTANVPILVAINKVDKVSSPAVIEDIKRQLAQHDLVPEDWGGETITVPISAKTGKGVDELLEMVVLQAQMMDLKANPSRPAKAYILETNMEVGHGPVATVICFDGTVKRGDYFISGSSSGKVRLLIDSFGNRVEQAGPSVPVKIVGFDKLSKPGDWFEVVSIEVYQKEKGTKAERATVPSSLLTAGVLGEGEIINIVLKSDTFGTSEAVLDSIAKLSAAHKDKEVFFKVVYSGVGDISEGDIALSVDTKSLILGMNVRVERNAALIAKDAKVNIASYLIIYKLIDFLEELLEKKKKKEIIEKKIGEGIILKIFDIKGKGIIAGGRIKEGIFSKEGKVSCVRNGKVIGSGKITSLQRDKKVVKEVHKGSEFAFFCSEFQDWQVDDIVECSVEKVKDR